MIKTNHSAKDLKKRSTLFWMSMVLFFSSTAFAETATALKAGIVNYAPFGIEGENDGIYYRVMQDISKESGIKINTDFIPRARLPISIKQSEIDLSIFVPSDDTLKYSECIAVLNNYPMQIVPYFQYPIQKYDDIYKLPKLGIVLGSYLPPEMASDKRLDGIKQDIRNYEMGFKMMEKGSLYGIYGAAPILRYYNEVMDIPPTFFGKPYTVDYAKVCLLMTNKSPNKALIMKTIKPAAELLFNNKLFEKTADRFFEDLKKTKKAS